MKQLYYTSCLPGRSKSGEAGFQVRAVSLGVAPERLRAVLRHVGYRLPQGYDEDTPPHEAPTRLALLDTDAGRLLCHSSHADRDPTTNRAGVFFTHMLLDLPESISTLAAIATWKSPEWQTRDGDLSVDLADLVRLPHGDVPPEAMIDGFARSHAPLLRFLLAGVLGLPADQRLFLVVPAEEVYLAVAWLVRQLPWSTGERLTFSTYERDPLSSNARVVGTWWKGRGLELPATCYNGAGLAFNTLTGKYSPLPPLQGFAAHLLELVSQGRVAELTSFYGECRSLGVCDLTGHELAWRLLRGRFTLTQPDAVQAAACPGLAARLVAQPGVVAQVVEWAMVDGAFRETGFPQLVQAAGAGQLFASAVWDAAVPALQRGLVDRGCMALRDVLPLANPAQSALLVERLANDLEPATLPWPARRALLEQWPQLLQCHAVQRNATRRDQWLAVSHDHFGELLALPMEEETRIRAARQCLARVLQPGPLLILLASNETLGLKLFETLACEPASHELLLALFRALLGQADRTQTGCRLVVWLGARFAGNRSRSAVLNLIAYLHDLHQQRRLSAAAFDACLMEAFRAHHFEPVEFAGASGRWLLAALPGGRSPARLAERLLREVPGNIDKVREFFKEFAQHPSLAEVPAELRARLTAPAVPVARIATQADMSRPAASQPAIQLLPVAVPATMRPQRQITVQDFLIQPTLDDETMRSVAQALQALPEGKERQRLAREVVAIVARCLVQLPEETVRQGLESVLAHLGPVASPGKSSLFGLGRVGPPIDRWGGLFRELLGLLQSTEVALKNPPLIFALLGVGFNADIRNPWLARQYDKGVHEDTARDTAAFLHSMMPRYIPVLNEVQDLVQKYWAKNSDAMNLWQRAISGRPGEKRNG